MNYLSGTTDRAKLLQGIEGYKQLKESLGSFLANFKGENNIVTEADIKHFFQSLNQK